MPDNRNFGAGLGRGETVYSLKQQLIEQGARLRACGLAAAGCGNISLLQGEAMLITASGSSLGFLQNEDIIIMDRQGQIISHSLHKQPSIESGLHRAIFAACPEAKAVVHTHPSYATALTMAGVDFNLYAPQEAQLILGEVGLVQALPAGSAELAKAAAEQICGKSAVLLAGHGALTVAATLSQAVQRMEALAHAAKTAYLAFMLQK